MGQNGDFDGFWDLTRLLEVVKKSNLVQVARNTPPDSLEAIFAVGRPYFTIKSLPGRPENKILGPKIGAKNGDFGGFLDISPLLEVINGSNPVQNDRNTPPDSLEAMYAVGRPYFTIKSLPGRPENKILGPKWRFWRFFGHKSTSRGHREVQPGSK